MQSTFQAPCNQLLSLLTTQTLKGRKAYPHELAASAGSSWFALLNMLFFEHSGGWYAMLATQCWAKKELIMCAVWVKETSYLWSKIISFPLQWPHRHIKAYAVVCKPLSTLTASVTAVLPQLREWSVVSHPQPWTLWTRLCSKLASQNAH
jgi:hypothetical protein